MNMQNMRHKITIAINEVQATRDVFLTYEIINNEYFRIGIYDEETELVDDNFPAFIITQDSSQAYINGEIETLLINYGDVK